MEKRFSKIAIVGSGAIGCYYGALLARSGVNVHFLMRGDCAEVRRRGLRVKTLVEEFVLPVVKVAEVPEEIGACDLVIVALKTTANGSFLKLIAPLLAAHTAILTLQNGLGSDEELARLFGKERVLGGLCFVCVNRVAPGEVFCLEPGKIALGEFGRPAGSAVRAVGELFARAGVCNQVGDDLAGLRWRKLVWNVPFNGLAIVAGGITTDRILADPALEMIVRALMAEVIAAAGRLGHAIPGGFIDEQIESTRPMGPYKPSSLVDYLAGKEIEVDAIWGEPLRRAREAGALVPHWSMLWTLIGSLTRR